MSSSLASVLQSAQDALVGSAGLIRSLEQVVQCPGEPRLFMVSSITANLNKISDIYIPGAQGGAGFSYEEAAIGAVGETVERYCSAAYSWDDLIYASAAELGAAAIGLDQFALYTDDVYNHPLSALERWDANQPIYWKEARSLHDGRLRYLPAVLVYTPFRLDSPKKSRMHAISVSSGQACHTDLATAHLSGLCEAIERDAFMITWMRRIPPTEIDIRADSLLDGVYRRYFECRGVQFRVFDITLDIDVPSFLCVGSGIGKRGRFMNVGAATRPDERDAIVKAMKEAAQGAAWAQDLSRTRESWQPTPNYDNLLDFEDHVRLYCEPDMHNKLDFILQTRKRRNPRSEGTAPKGVPDQLSDCLQSIQNAGLEAVAVDLTTPEIAELGFHVPKVMVPGLAQLTAVHALPALLSPRFDEVPRRLGLTDPVHYLNNPDPHPFP